MPARDGFQLTEQDVELLQLAFEYRILRLDHLAALTGRPYRRLSRRLLKLLERRYLRRLKLAVTEPLLYYLSPAGSAVLVERGLAPREALARRVREGELSALFLKHEQMVVDLHVALALATRNGPLRLSGWQEGKRLWDRVAVRGAAGRGVLPVRPDGFFTLEDSRRPEGRNRRHFFLEADRSSTTHERFQVKIAAYWHYLRGGHHIARYGIKSFRVVTVTLTPDRARGLCEAAASAVPPEARDRFLFASLEDFSLAKPEPILAPVFITARDWRAASDAQLMPPPQASLTSSSSGD